MASAVVLINAYRLIAFSACGLSVAGLALNVFVFKPPPGVPIGDSTMTLWTSNCADVNSSFPLAANGTTIAPASLFCPFPEWSDANQAGLQAARIVCVASCTVLFAAFLVAWKWRNRPYLIAFAVFACGVTAAAVGALVWLCYSTQWTVNGQRMPSLKDTDGVHIGPVLVLDVIAWLLCIVLIFVGTRQSPPEEYEGMPGYDCHLQRRNEGRSTSSCSTPLLPDVSSLTAINFIRKGAEGGPIKRIDVASGIMQYFLMKTMDTRDRCSVTAFNDDYRPLVNLGPEHQCGVALQATRTHCSGSTSLYTAVVGSVLQFVATADKSRGWLLVILTDGEDSGRGASLSQAAEALLAFNRPADNFVVVVGIGEEGGNASLRHLAASSASLFVHAANNEMLMHIFALLALQVVEGVQIDVAAISRGGHDVDAIFARVTQHRSVQRSPVDMLFLIDVSGSMNTVV